MKKYLIALSFIILMLFGFTLNASAAPPTLRLAGQDRYKTAVEISKSYWYSSDNVVLATGENFPDALCAVPLAKQLNAPVLLTEKSWLNAETENELYRLKTKRVYIIGGEGVVADSVKSQLESKGITCFRIAGTDRYETSILVANYLSINFKMSDSIAVVTGEDFSDALSISPVAAKNNIPIILVSKDYIPESLKTFLKQRGIAKTYIVGGNYIISDNVAQQLPNVERILGNDKYERNINILTRFARDVNFSTTYVATGEDFPDALAGAALAQGICSPIVLTSKIPPKTTRDYISNMFLTINQVKVLGGEAVVPSSTLQDLLSSNAGLLKVHFMDVGQGDSILIQTPSGKNMLIDGSNNGDGDAIASYLKSLGVRTLDVVVGTNPQEEHIGGLDTIIKNFNIGKLYMPKITISSASYRDLMTMIQLKNLAVTEPVPGSNIDIDPSVEVQILAPNKSNYDSLSDHSIVLKITYGAHSFLLTGDAGSLSEDEMISNGHNLSASVIKLGNHGSDSSSSSSFLDRVNPQYAVVSVGRGNTNNNPSYSIISNLERKGARVYRTDESGTIVCSTNGMNISFDTFPGNRLYLNQPSNNSEISAVVNTYGYERYSTVQLSITGPSGAEVTAVCHFRDKDITYSGTIDSKNEANVTIPIDKTLYSNRLVNVDISVSYNGKTYTTRTSFMPQ